MKKSRVYIGTSGWHYKHWMGTFYPADLQYDKLFDYYKKCFDSVEINNSFYKLPSPETFKNWKTASPRGFIFSVKASRFITHMKKLKMNAQELKKFFTAADKLEKKLGPILFQLPPRWNVNAERLAAFLSVLPKGYLYAFEFRNQSWYNNDIYELLRQHNCAFCIYELNKHLSPFEVTGSFIYIRLHGPGSKYHGSYTDAQLRQWVTRCRKWQENGKSVYVYFDNDQAGYAALNAKRLKQLLSIKSI